MSTIGQRIRELRDQKGMKQKALAEKSGLSNEHLSKIELGKETNLRASTIEAIAKALGVDSAFLQYGTASGREYSPSEYLDPSKWAPAIGLARAGRSGFFTEQGYPSFEGFDKVERPPDLTGLHVYGVKLEGDSMVPRFQEGDIVLVDPDVQPQAGNYVIAMIDTDEVMIKKLSFHNDFIILKSLNPSFEDIVLPRKRVKFLHKVMYTKFR